MPNEPHGPVEGGGKHGPFREDFFQRIMDVSWGGGVVFIYGLLGSTNVYYVKFKSNRDKLPVRHTIRLPGPGVDMTSLGSSYALVHARSVFLVTANRATFRGVDDGAGNIIRATEYHLMVYISSDGLNWSVAHQQDVLWKSTSEPAAGNSCALVWNPDKNLFYYDQNVEAHDQIFNSSNGVGWGMISSTPSGYSGYKSAFPSLCSNNDCLDDLGQHVPDGVMVYDKKKKITIKPVMPAITDYSQGTHSFSFASGDPQETWGSSQVEVTQHTVAGKITAGFKSTVSIPGVAKVFGVAGANGIFMAGGAADIAGDSGAIAFSLDDGKSWQLLAKHPSSVTTVIAAPLGDIKSS